MPGKSWWSGFKRRHPELSLRTTEGIDNDRAINLRPEVVSKFYTTLVAAYDTGSYAPHQIWNYDEIGIQAGRNGSMRVLARRGSRNVSYILPKSREWLTILVCVNAIGQSIPSFYLFKGKKHLQNYIARCEPGACMAVQPHAWMTKELFLNWLHHFARSVPGGVSPTNRHLLIFDGHGSHVAVTTIEEARMLGIDLLTLLAHTSHKLQPLDVSVFFPFKTYFKYERAAWMAKYPGIEIKKAELAELSSKSLQKALSSSNIIGGFKRTCIWPINLDALVDDMHPSETYQFTTLEEASAVQNILSLSDAFVTCDEMQQCMETITTDLDAVGQGMEIVIIII